MRQFDRPEKPSAAAAFARFSEPAILICAALALAVAMLSLRIISIW